MKHAWHREAQNGERRQVPSWFRKMVDEGLRTTTRNAEKKAYLFALATEPTITQARTKARVSRTSVDNWFRYDSEFAELVGVAKDIMIGGLEQVHAEAESSTKASTYRWYLNIMDAKGHNQNVAQERALEEENLRVETVPLSKFADEVDLSDRDTNPDWED